MAVPSATFERYFNDPLLDVLREHQIRLVEVDLEQEEIVRWIN
jgi:hypothetical protein